MKKVILLLIGSLVVFWSYAQETDEIVGGNPTKAVSINGLQYKLGETTRTAMVANGNSWEGELNIPEQVTYDGKTIWPTSPWESHISVK